MARRGRETRFERPEPRGQLSLDRPPAPGSTAFVSGRVDDDHEFGPVHHDVKSISHDLYGAARTSETVLPSVVAIQIPANTATRPSSRSRVSGSPTSCCASRAAAIGLTVMV